jgi:hypothetical protein
VPNSAVNAVGILATPFVTLNPAFSATSASAAADFFSWYPGSANSQSLSATGQFASACAAADLTAASFCANAAAGRQSAARTESGRMAGPVGGVEG